MTDIVIMQRAADVPRRLVAERNALLRLCDTRHRTIERQIAKIRRVRAGLTMLPATGACERA